MRSGAPALQLGDDVGGRELLGQAGQGQAHDSAAGWRPREAGWCGRQRAPFRGLDEDETMVKFDNQCSLNTRAQRGCRDTLHYQHQQPHTEPLLAIPDAIAWCWAKGGQWRSLISPAVESTREV